MQKMCMYTKIEHLCCNGRKEKSAKLSFSCMHARMQRDHYLITFKTTYIHIHNSRVSNIESDDSQNVGLEDYNNIFDRIFPNFTTPSIKITLW